MITKTPTLAEKEPAKVEEKVSPSEPNSPPVASKIVEFRWTEGRWSVDASTTGDVFFTDRDFNQLVQLLQHQRPLMRRKAYQAFIRSQQTKNAVISESSTLAIKE